MARDDRRGRPHHGRSGPPSGGGGKSRSGPSGPGGPRGLGASRVGGSPSSGGATEILYGLRAGLAIVETRPEDVVRIAWSREVAGEVEPFAAKLAGRGVRGDVLSDGELERIARTNQHEGLCLEVKPRRWVGPNDLADRLVSQKGTAIALDRVRNSYNVGAILRVAGFFGIDAAILGAPAPHPALDPNAVRVAEGGAERLVLSRTTDLAETLTRLRARGIMIVGADGASSIDALDHRFVRPAVVIVGNEREGMSPRVRAQCDAIVAIRGSGEVESLNVAVASGILVARLARA